jgi:hypothetical protein
MAEMSRKIPQTQLCGVAWKKDTVAKNPKRALFAAVYFFKMSS